MIYVYIFRGDRVRDAFMMTAELIYENLKQGRYVDKLLKNFVHHHELRYGSIMSYISFSGLQQMLSGQEYNRELIYYLLFKGKRLKIPNVIPIVKELMIQDGNIKS